MNRRHHRHPATGVAMIVGALLGITLLAWMRPGTVVEPLPVRDLGEFAPVDPLPPAAAAPRRSDPVGVRAPPRGPSILEEGIPRTDTGAAPERALLLVDVVDSQGRPSEGGYAEAVDCPGFEVGPKPGSYFADPGSCTVQARRRDGMLTARGETARAELIGGEIAYLTLELDNARTGGIGVRFHPEPGGMRVLSVVEGSAAWKAGLDAGDLIVGVEGVAVRGLSNDTFIQAMTGAEGTDVAFRVQFPTDTGIADEQIRVTRGFLGG